MSKELTPLDALKELRYRITNFNGKFHNYNELMGTIETALKNYESMKQIKIIVTDKKISDDDLEKLKNQRMFVGDLGQCEIKPLFDEETENKLKAFDIIKETIGIKISADENVGCLYIHITNGKTIVLGYVYGKEKIDLLKEVLL